MMLWTKVCPTIARRGSTRVNANDAVGGALRIHRADLQRGLIQHLPLLKSSKVQINSTCALHLNHHLINYTQTGLGGIMLHFDNKPSKECDVLIGSDGIKSTVRQLFLSRLPNPQKYRKYYQPMWSGLVAYRGLVSREELEETCPGHRALTDPGLTVRYPHIITVCSLSDNPMSVVRWCITSLSSLTFSRCRTIITLLYVSTLPCIPCQEAGSSMSWLLDGMRLTIQACGRGHGERM
jgi:2-polyprenyl-6-methoxyphenol hydroxylase-like FAD-dependent oxidoreductase